MSLSMLKITDTQISYHRPVSSRSGVGFLGVVLGVGCLSLIYLIWPSPSLVAYRSPADLGQMVAFLIVPIIGLCGPTALSLYEAGPLDLVINLSQHTYQFRRGFPFLASWQSGPLDDIADLRVKTVKNNFTTYQIMLDWKNTQAAPWTLGDRAVSSRRPTQIMFSREESEVYEEIARLAPLLGVPIKKAAPIWDDVRRRAIIRLVLVPAILFFTLMGLSPLLVGNELEAEGQTAKGIVTELRDGKGLSVRYTYRVGTHVFDGSVGVPGSVYLSLRAGGPVPVRYLPAYPHTSTVDGLQDVGDSGLMLAAAGLLALVLIAYCIPLD